MFDTGAANIIFKIIEILINVRILCDATLNKDSYKVSYKVIQGIHTMCHLQSQLHKNNSFRELNKIFDK